MKSILNLIIILFFTNLSFAQTWTVQNSSTNQSLVDVKIIDQDIAVAVGVNGTIVRTSNGGTNWSTISTPTTTNFYGLEKQGDTLHAVGNFGVYLRSLDAGLTWSQISLSGNSNDCYKSMVLLDDQTLLASGGTCYSSNGPFIYKSTNGGDSWTQIPFSGSSALYKFSYHSGNNIALGAWHGKTYLSSDGGQNWTQHVTTTQPTVNCSIKPNGDVMSVGYNSNYFYKTNNSNSWSTINNLTPTLTYPNITFVDNNIGYMVFQDNSNNSGRIYKTTTGGQSMSDWVLEYSSPHRLIYVDFLTSDLGYAVGANGTILKYSGPDCSNPTPVITGNDTTICLGDSMQLSAYNVPTKGWINSTSWTVSPTQETHYIAFGIDSDGCYSYDTLKVYVLPSSVPSLSYNSSTGVLSCSQNYGTYKWYLNGILVSTQQSFVPVVGGNYSFQVGEERCVTWANINISMSTSDINPDDSQFELINTGNGETVRLVTKGEWSFDSYKIYSVQGKLMKHNNVNSTSAQYTDIDVSGLQKGIYFIRVKNDKGLIVSKKFIRN
jgi:photosystem II stability/assembly factor-like uncharacterized protein